MWFQTDVSSMAIILEGGYLHLTESLRACKRCRISLSINRSGSYCAVAVLRRSKKTIKKHRKEIWIPQKDDILYCKKDYRSEVLNIDKHAVGIYKEDSLVGHGFITEDPMEGVSRGNLSWPRGNIFTKVNVMERRNLFLWRAMGGSKISCVVMVFRYVVKQQQHSKILNG